MAQWQPEIARENRGRQEGRRLRSAPRATLLTVAFFLATAIFLGGPGALFWMWCTALVGMATKYAEAVCAVKYREVDELGNHVGGPMYYIKNGMGPKWAWLGFLFALFGAIAGFGIEVGLVAVSLHPGDPGSDDVRDEALPVGRGIGERSATGGYDGLGKASIEVGVAGYDLHQPDIIEVDSALGILHPGTEHDVFCPLDRFEMARAQQNEIRSGSPPVYPGCLMDENAFAVIVEDNQLDPTGAGDTSGVGISLDIVSIAGFRGELLKQGGISCLLIPYDPNRPGSAPLVLVGPCHVPGAFLEGPVVRNPVPPAVGLHAGVGSVGYEIMPIIAPPRSVE